MNIKKMLQRHAAVLLPVLFLIAASPALATHIETFSGTADCSGFVVNATVIFRTYPIVVGQALVDYNVVLSQAGAPVQTRSGQVVIVPASPVISLAGLWDGDLCGDYTVAGTIVLTTPAYPSDNGDVRNQRNFAAAFNCDCPVQDACHFTPGYWKNHASLWPMTSFSLGGVAYNQTQLLAILRQPVRGDATVILAHHLIAAMLNVANGASAGIQGSIDDANAFLSAHPFGSNPSDPARSQGLAIKDLLAGYNEMGCPDGADKGLPLDGEDSASSWGELKAIYR
jgi:hypothetical protein